MNKPNSVALHDAGNAPKGVGPDFRNDNHGSMPAAPTTPAVINRGFAAVEPANDPSASLPGIHKDEGFTDPLRTYQDGLVALDGPINPQRTVIKYEPAAIQRVTREAADCLASTGMYFQREGTIVTVTTDSTDSGAVIQVLNSTMLMHALDGVAEFKVFDRRAHDWITKDPHAVYLAPLLTPVGCKTLPVLRGITRQAFLRADGSVCSTPGYDASSGLYGVFSEDAFDVPATPTRLAAEEALALLKDLLAEFPFANDVDQAAALSALLTAAVRPGLSAAPMFHVRAHEPGVGKSYLCSVISALATEGVGTPTNFPGSEDECTKQILAELLRSPAIIEFDNLKTDLSAWKSLCVALTAEKMRGRVLGRSKTAEVSTRVMFLSSGNNCSPIADMARRCVVINLNAACEMPAGRTFERPTLIQDVRRERAKFVSAALTIVRAWIVAKKPVTPCSPVASFNSWSDWCRQPLLWLGCADAAASIFSGMAEDPDRELVGRLISALKKEFGTHQFRVRDIIQKANDIHRKDDDLRDVIEDIGADGAGVNSRRLGRWIAGHVGQFVGGQKLVKTPVTRNSLTWNVVSVKSVIAVSAAPLAETSTESDVIETVERIEDVTSFDAADAPADDWQGIDLVGDWPSDEMLE